MRRWRLDRLGRPRPHRPQAALEDAPLRCSSGCAPGLTCSRRCSTTPSTTCECGVHVRWHGERAACRAASTLLPIARCAAGRARSPGTSGSRCAPARLLLLISMPCRRPSPIAHAACHRVLAVCADRAHVAHRPRAHPPAAGHLLLPHRLPVADQPVLRRPQAARTRRRDGNPRLEAGAAGTGERLPARARTRSPLRHQHSVWAPAAASTRQRSELRLTGPASVMRQPVTLPLRSRHACHCAHRHRPACRCRGLPASRSSATATGGSTSVTQRVRPPPRLPWLRGRQHWMAASCALAVRAMLAAAAAGARLHARTHACRCCMPHVILQARRGTTRWASCASALGSCAGRARPPCWC